MSGFRKSLFLSFCDRYASLIINLAAMAALARLLTPSEVGTYLVAVALIGLADTFREFGVPAYLIQKPTLSEHCIRTAFTLIFGLSCVFAAVFLLLRDAVASFYGEPGMRQAIAVAAFNFLLVPIPVTISALLRRGMAFEAVTVSSVAGAFAAATMSVLLAFLHFGFMSPIWGALTGSVATTLVCLAYRPDMRIFRPTLADWRGVVGFGGYSSATALINVLHQSSPQLILGRVLDLAAAGLYSRAVTVSQLFDKLVLDVLRPVIMPALSERARAGADLRKIYLQALEHITVLHWPPLIFLALTADPVVDLLFGSQWTAIVPIVRIVAAASLVLSPACLTYPVLVSLGGIRDTFTASLISVPLSLLVMFIASFFGILAVAASTFVTAPLQVFVALAFIRRYLAFGIGDLLRAVRKSAAVTVCATAGALPVIAAGRFDLDDMSIAGMSGVAFATAAGWSLGLWVTKHPLLAELQDIALAVRRRGWLRRPDLPAIRRRTEAAHTKG